VTSIDIEDDGTVKIFSASPEAIENASNWVKVLAGQIKAGDRFNGKIRSAREGLGLFVELVPGVDGLVHISMLPREKQQSLQNSYKDVETLPVIVENYDAESGRIRLRILDDKK
jgi:polyribonucleotide nucleotidyltransferase